MLNREWIGPDGAYLEIKGIAAFLSVGYRHRKTFIELRDTLLNMNRSYANTPGHEQASSADENFRILQLTGDTLALKPINQNAAKLFKTGGRVLFVSRRYFATTPFKLQAIEYSCAGGKRPGSVRIKIDSAGKLQFKSVGRVADPKGFFKGQLSTAQLDTLNRFLQNSAIDRFKMSWLLGFKDVDTYTFKIHYNNKVLEETGNIVPYFGVDLRDFLDRIYQEVTLERGNDDAEIQ